jgi:hypothetical protein
MIARAETISADARFLEGSVHPLDLAVGPGMLGLGEAMIEVGLGAQAGSKPWAQSGSPRAMASLILDR